MNTFRKSKGPGGLLRSACEQFGIRFPTNLQMKWLLVKPTTRVKWWICITKCIGVVFPKELFTGVKMSYKIDCKLGFGEYVQVFALR